MESTWWLSFALAIFLRLSTTTFLSLPVMGGNAGQNSFDASDITWAHAVNSREALEKELAGPVDFLEADVSLGHVMGNDFSPRIPIMAHPPNATSDISLDTWLDIVIARRAGKGVKLDFKSLDVVEPSLIILRSHENKLNFSLWLNADVLPGPINSSTMPVQVDLFLALCHQYFPKATLSVGWTTYWFSSFPPEAWHYGWKHMRQMADVIHCSGYESNYPTFTFPVRAVFASRSISELQWLLGVTPGSSLTVWSATFDQVELKDLLRIRASFPKNRVYYDIPEPLNGIFNESKQSIKTPDDKVSHADKEWIVINRGQSDPCTSYTYIHDKTIVFGRNVTTAVLLTKLLFVDSSHRLKVRGRLRFFEDAEQRTSSGGKHQVVITLTDVSLFSKNTSSGSDENIDLSQSDSEVIWSAVNASQLYKFEYSISEKRTDCRMFNLDTMSDRAFEAWTVPCDIIREDDGFEEVVKSGVQEISSRKRLVLPSGPFMLGFVSSGEGHAVIYDLEIFGTQENIASKSSITNISLGVLFIILASVFAHIFVY